MQRNLTSSSAIPVLWFFTDPVRTPDPVAIARGLPRGAAVVYRHFGAADRVAVARQLRAIRGLILLIGADWRLAASVRADGVHLPERLGALAPRLKHLRPSWLVSVATHDRPPRIGPACAADAFVLSPVFPSRSPSAGRPLGAARARRLARDAIRPVIALGGITRRDLAVLRASGFAGVAGIDLFLKQKSRA